MRTAPQDRNFLSFNRDSVVWFAGTSEEQRETGIVPTELLPDDPKLWDSILKFSGRQSTALWNLEVAQGKESACDINNESAYISLKGEWGLAGREGEWIFKIKGGSHHISISGDVYSRGRFADFSLGEWSDQSIAPVSDLDLSGLTHVSGRSLTFVLGRVKNPLLALFGLSKDIKLPPNAKILFWRSIGEMLYWWGKWAAMKLGFFQ